MRGEGGTRNKRVGEENLGIAKARDQRKNIVAITTVHYPLLDLVRDGIGDTHCSTCCFTISLDVLLASMTKTRVFRAGSKSFL